MAHSTSIPATQQAPKAQSDWYTFLRNAFINGFQAYGAALMVAAPEPASSHPVNQETCTPKVGAPGPSHLGTWENSTKAQEASFREQPVALSQPALALPHTPFAEPAWRNA